MICLGSKTTEPSGVAVPNDLAQRTKDTAAFVRDHGTPNRYSPAIAKSYASEMCDRIAGSPQDDNTAREEESKWV
jgi:hypothetical protein